jgi:TolB-like protein/tetratricopeptide (TPR) repeat protein
VSLIAELKRRKVFRVAVAYLVVAWLVIQVGATVAPQLALPDWAPRLITLLVLLGFPISLVVAWMVDVTPDGIKVEAAGFGNKRVFTVAAVLAALAIGWFLRGYDGGDPREAAPATAALGERSTAVLPFVNMSADKDNEYFSDGLTETLLHKLAQVSELKVAARTSSFAFKGRNSDVRAIGTELGVATVVEGSVQRAGDTLRITAQLVRTADGSHIWSKSYDRKLTDLFAIQDEIAGAVTEALVGALMPEAKAAIARGGTTDVAAYDLYAHGLQEQGKATYESLDRAEHALQQALERDPRYVDAMVGLVSVWWDMLRTGKIADADFVGRSAPVLERAAALEPGHPLVLAFAAIHAHLDGRGDEGTRLFEQAIAAHPDHAQLRGLYADSLRGAGSLEAVLDQYSRAVLLDPLNVEYQMNRAALFMRLGRMADADATARRATEIDPGNLVVMVLLGDIAQLRGDEAGFLENYLRARQVDRVDHELAASIALGLAEIGEHEAADAWLAESRRLKPGNAVSEANATLIHFARGEHEAALAGAIALAPRHQEERRNEWALAVGAGCLAAIELGRVDALRTALLRAGAASDDLGPEGFRRLANKRFTAEYHLQRSSRLAPCLMDAGPAGAAQRAQLLRAWVEIVGPDWATVRWRGATDGWLRGDRERVAAALQPDAVAGLQVSGYPLRAAWLRWAGYGDDPAVVAWRAAAESRLARARAELPQRLAAAGVSLTP